MGRSKRSFDLLLLLWPLGKVQSWAARHPLLGRFVHVDVSPDRNRHIIIPVNRVISGTESVMLPPAVLEALVARASRHVTLNQCLCRRAEGCHTYPRDLGCLFLGDAAGQIDPELGRSLAPEEALAHARQAVAQGLVPMIIHAAYDAELLGIDYDRMLAVCFCCDCCCTVRQNLHSGPHEFGDSVLRLPGLRVEVGPACDGCGACLDLCHVGTIHLEEGRAVIDEACKGCGRCATACPQDAIRLHLDDGAHVMDHLFALVEERTAIGAVT
jgi:UDP-glucose 4-epimerase